MKGLNRHWDQLGRIRRALRELKIPLHAANAGFFLVLSLFPGLVLFLSLLRLIMG